MNSKAIAIVSFCLIVGVYFLMARQAPVSEPNVNEPVLSDLRATNPTELQAAVSYFQTISTPTDEDLHNLAYAFVAFSFTPLALPEDYRDRYGTSSGGGLVAGVRNLTNTTKNITERTRALAKLEAEFRPKKKLARQKGVEIWHKLAARSHEQAIIGLAWYYGKIEQYTDAYFFRRIASLGGDGASDYWARRYSERLTSETILELEEEIKSITGTGYNETYKASLAKDLVQTMTRLENLDEEIETALEKLDQQLAVSGN